MPRSVSLLLAPVLAGFALLLGGCGSDNEPVATVQDLNDDRGYHGAWLDRPYQVPHLALTDTAGEPYVVASDPAPLTLVFFGYTKCPDVCQVAMSTITAAVARLEPAERRRVQVAFVTTDPARDTRPVLRRYLDRFDARFVGLTGPLDRIVALGRPMAVYVKKGERLPSGGYDLEHSASVAAVRGDRVPLVWSHDVSPADLAADLDRLLTHENAA
ncbi:MAG TPA: SCO family protein [Marmoricola sp.]|nr:SCO family protein [Marmoricola sp.]